ncbi:Uu.00g061660.m01.CDS01 [Anthostomella pinea]|uniref:Uu.00g061660.m01.CDS01 n=1 Tax=Anthostomella pinea TaxID=933095 RepID=A0AAI8VSJ1_9PEZI|nr:Uu.00g061660.m01.CDS01 [Anthostomella pinea]
MSIQRNIGSSGLVAAGVGVGDVATLVSLGYRIGNWFTAEKGDVDFLALIEESEFDFLKRQGVIDIQRFDKTWSCRVRLLENGVPQHFEGAPVKNLLSSTCHWTVMMTCIVAVLDEFASSSTVRNICKEFLRRLFSSEEGVRTTQDLLDSSLQIRINGWRSAAVVREMNVACQRIHIDLLKQGLMVQGFMPSTETAEAVEFLYWLVCQKTEVHRTTSSDIAAIAYCLTNLSFEVLTVKNFCPSSGRETSCCLIYDNAPIYTGAGTGSMSTAMRQRFAPRELSTTVSLTQPEETFSTFPISRDTAARCRDAWQQGIDAGKPIILGPGESAESGFTCDLIMTFRNKGESVANQRRIESGAWRIASLLAVFSTDEVNGKLSVVLGLDSPGSLSRIAEVITSDNMSGETGLEVALNEPTVLEAFTVCQAFFMGYYYKIFSSIVDTSTLEVKTVAGCWGYRSADFLRRIHKSFQRTNGLISGSDKNQFSMTRTDVLSFIATMYANIDVKLPKGGFVPSLSHQELCAGVVGKRIVLLNSLINECETIQDIFRFVILDCDAGGIPRTSEGLVLTGIPPRVPTWEECGQSPGTEKAVVLVGSKEYCTRHIEANWDGLPEHMLLCIRYKGRRTGALNPVQADIIFCLGSIPSSPEETPRGITFGPAYSCSLDELVDVGRVHLVTPGREYPDMPVVVHTKGNSCLRYAMAAWYADQCDVVLVKDSLQQAFEYWKTGGGKSGSHHKFVALIG